MTLDFTMLDEYNDRSVGRVGWNFKQEDPWCWTSDSNHKRRGELWYSKFVTNLRVLLIKEARVLVFTKSERKLEEKNKIVR